MSSIRSDIIHASDPGGVADSPGEVVVASGPPGGGPPPLSPDEAAVVSRALGHPVRLRILTILGGRGECFCGDLCQEFDLAQSTISQHLKVLRKAGLVRATPCGTAVGYCVDRSRIDAYRRWVQGLVGSNLP